MSEAQAEEVKIDLSQFKEDASSEETTEEYSEVESQAMEHGWTPEGVEGKRNLTAEEFMDRQPLYDDIKSHKKQIKQLKEGVEALRKHNETIAERERAKVVAELKQAKKLALEQENYDAVVELDDRIAESKASVPVPETQAKNAEFDAFVEDNPWYQEDQELTTFADALGTSYLSNNPHIPVDKVYSYVASQVKQRWPEKFSVPARRRPSPVEGAQSGRAATKSKYSAKDLPEDARQMMKTIVKSGALTEQEYLKQYFD